MSKYPADEEQLQRIKTGDSVFIKTVYAEYREACLAFLKGYFSCSDKNAIEVYQEAFTIFYYNIKDEKLQPPLKSLLTTYLYSVGIRVYHKMFLGTYQNKITFPEDWEEGIAEADILEAYDLAEQKTIVTKLLGSLKDSCQQLLRLMYFDNVAAREVAVRMGFNSPAAVRKHKFDCLQKMRLLLQKDQPNA